MQDQNDSNAVSDGASVVAVKVKKSVGRPRDVTGETALGKARLIYKDNRSLSASELREKLFAELEPLFNSSKSTCQTYVSLLRKEERDALAKAAESVTP